MVTPFSPSPGPDYPKILYCLIDKYGNSTCCHCHPVVAQESNRLPTLAFGQSLDIACTFQWRA
jgi:hypothetical protein